MDEIQNRPEASLPWKTFFPEMWDGYIIDASGQHWGNAPVDDLDYIVHACNAYPKLIGLLRSALVTAGKYPMERGDVTAKTYQNEIEAFLKHLGEWNQ